MKKLLYILLLPPFLCNAQLLYKATVNGTERFINFNPSGKAYEAESVALFARMSPKPNQLQKMYIDSFIFKQKRDTILQTKECIYWINNPNSEANCLLNWISASYNLTKTGTPNIIKGRWFTDATTSNYLNTGFNPSTDSSTYKLNNALISAFATDISFVGSTQYLIGARNTTSKVAYIETTTTAIRGAINMSTTGVSIYSSTVQTPIYISIQRVAANRIELYVNGVQRDADATISSAAPEREFFLGCANNAGTPLNANATAKMYYFSIGSKLSSTQQVKEYNNCLWFATKMNSIR